MYVCSGEGQEGPIPFWCVQRMVAVNTACGRRFFNALAVRREGQLHSPVKVVPQTPTLQSGPRVGCVHKAELAGVIRHHGAGLHESTGLLRGQLAYDPALFVGPWIFT